MFLVHEPVRDVGHAEPSQPECLPSGSVRKTAPLPDGCCVEQCAGTHSELSGEDGGYSWCLLYPSIFSVMNSAF